VQKNVTISSEEAQNATKKAESPTPCSIALNAEKRIQRIMVFYSDNSYETFVPSSDK
jgi:hypothetical protein